jgi:hypothetical protein
LTGSQDAGLTCSDSPPTGRHDEDSESFRGGDASPCRWYIRIQ